MNVLQLTLSFRPGGRRVAVTRLTRELRRMGVRCDLACLDELGCAQSEVAGLADELLVLDRRSLFDRRAQRKLLAHCRRRQIDVIHAHDAASQFAGALLRLRRPRTKLLMTFHRSLGFESASVRDRVRNAMASKLCGAVVVGSRERRDHYLRENFVHPRKLVRIPFGVDTEQFSPRAEERDEARRELGCAPDEIVCGAVGHFGEEKGIDVVLQAFDAVVAQNMTTRPVKLLVCGDGTPEQRERMQQIAVTAGTHVLFLGFRKDLPRVMQACDLFVHAPRIEAFGLVLIEAMASGLPVVATDVGGISDIVVRGETGIFVPPGSPGELAHAMATLIGDDDLRQAMGRAGLARARTEYHLSVYAARHLALYAALHAGNAARGVDDETERPKQTESGSEDQLVEYAP